MEGVMLVEMSSGSLHYTKSFSDAFDVRHPKTERLNLGALIFALQNFAGSSIRPNDTSADPIKDQRSGVGAAIGMFATATENMVLTTTPSDKLLVVLFTTPKFDANVAKWFVGRVAFNYDDSAEMQLMTVLNQVPRRFRIAFIQAVDETVERELVRLGESLLLSSERKRENYDVHLMPGDGELFLFFHYSARMNDSNGIDSDIEADRRAGSASLVSPDNHQEEFRKAVRAGLPTLADISSRGSKSASLSNMMSSTRATITRSTNLVKRDNIKKTKPRKQKTRWGTRNAVMHHSEPHEFQRVVEVYSRESMAASMEPHRTGRAFGIADVLLPFVELSGLFATHSSTLPNSQVTLQRPQKLEQLVWRNTPGAVSSRSEEQGGASIVVWRSGPCCIFYPATAVSMNPGNKPRVRLAVNALFGVLEAMLNAKMIIV